MHELLKETAHRPWPLPDGPWVMEQTWRDLLFAHWSFDIDVVRALVPEQLPLDTIDGRAWVSVVPFELTDLKARGIPALPGISAFAELNVRTYVTLDGKPGVYFFSLDAANKLAVMGARTFFHLNYLDAEMSIRRTASDIQYTSKRTDARGPQASFHGSYTPISEPLPPQPGTLDHFLTERYCLYAVSAAGGVYRTEITHGPWLLQKARAELDARSMLTAAGLPAPAAAPLLHFSRTQPMLAWAPEKVG